MSIGEKSLHHCCLVSFEKEDPPEAAGSRPGMHPKQRHLSFPLCEACLKLSRGWFYIKRLRSLVSPWNLSMFSNLLDLSNGLNQFGRSRFLGTFRPSAACESFASV